MRFPGLVGPTYPLPALNLECQRTVNLFPEKDELGTAANGEIAALIGCPGLKRLAVLGSGPNRGEWTTANGDLYVVSGSDLYAVPSTFVGIQIGTLNTSTGRVGMSDNGKQLIVVDGPNGYVYTFATTTAPAKFAQIAQTGSAAVFTASIPANSTTMTVTSVQSGSIAAGNFIYGSQVLPGVAIDSFISGTGGAGTYKITKTMGVDIPSEQMTALASNGTGFPGGTSVTFLDGSFIVNAYPSVAVPGGGGQFNWSALYDGTSWNALDFETAESNPDYLVAVFANHDVLGLLGSQSVEFRFVTADPTAPFAKIPGSTINYGCSAAASVAQFANTVMWLGSGPNGQGVVWSVTGYQPTRISNHAVESAIQACGDLTTATAWAYQSKGHMFYVLNLPGALTSWVYDAATGQWHERAYLQPDGTYSRHLADCHAWAYGQHIVGDYSNGNLYALDDATHTDNGNPIRWMRRSPHLSADMRRTFHARFQLDAQMGTMADGYGIAEVDTYVGGSSSDSFVDIYSGGDSTSMFVDVYSGGSSSSDPIPFVAGGNPQVSLRYSDDFGNTWSNARARSLGLIGQYRNRCFWDRLGSSFNRVYEISGSDPVSVVILGAELDITPGGK